MCYAFADVAEDLLEQDFFHFPWTTFSGCVWIMEGHMDGGLKRGKIMMLTVRFSLQFSFPMVNPSTYA